MSTAVRPYRRRIGEILVNDGVVSQEQIEEALTIQQRTGDLLGTILMDMGVVTESDIAKTLCVQYQLPFISLVNYEFDEKLVTLLPKEFLHRHRILPFDKVGDMLLMMVAEIPVDSALAEIPKLTRLNAALYVGYFSEVEKSLNRLVPLKDATTTQNLGKAARAIDAPTQLIDVGDDDGGEDVEDSADTTTTEDTRTLVFGDTKQAFLEELDSTWDSIFEQTKGKAKAKGLERLPGK